MLRPYVSFTGRCRERRRPWQTCCGACTRTPATVAAASDCANRSRRRDRRPSAGPRWTPTDSTAIRSPAVSTGLTRWSAGQKWTRPVSRATRSPVSAGSRPWRGTVATTRTTQRTRRPGPSRPPTPNVCSARDRSNSGSGSSRSIIPPPSLYHHRHPQQENSSSSSLQSPSRRRFLIL